VVWLTSSSDFLRSSALQGANGGLEDAFVTKLNAGGSTLIYGTYLDGNGHECGKALALDGGGDVYIARVTYSSNLLLTNAWIGQTRLHACCASQAAVACFILPARWAYTRGRAHNVVSQAHKPIHPRCLAERTNSLRLHAS
jgi:hypothetical protein